MAKSYKQYFYRVFNEFVTTDDIEKGYESNIGSEELYKEKDKDIVPAGETWIKVGIQAPPGTWFYINSDSQKIMMGKSGVFELEDVEINHLWFEKNYSYVLDPDQTGIIAQKALNQQLAAKSFYDTYVKTTENLEDYYKQWFTYYNGDDIYFTLEKDPNNGEVTIKWYLQPDATVTNLVKYVGHKEAEQMYLLSQYGVYMQEKVNGQPKIIDLENIIIDCVLKTSEGAKINE